MHYYPHNIGNYRRDTGHLSTIEHGIYRQLLDWYYLDEKPIPKETQVVIRRLRLGTDLEAQALATVLSEFFQLHEDGYHQDQCDAEIAQYQRNALKNQINGKLGGRPKKTQSVNSGKPKQSRTKGNQELINQENNKHKPINTPPPPPGGSEGVTEVFSADSNHDQENPSGFDAFWNAWPRTDRKQAKGLCLEVWKKTQAEQESTVILAHIAQLKNSERWQRNDGRFIPSPLKYLNEKRWEGAEDFEASGTGVEEFSTNRHVSTFPMSFAERDELAKRRRWEEMTGRKWPEPTTSSSDWNSLVIDVEPVKE